MSTRATVLAASFPRVWSKAEDCSSAKATTASRAETFWPVAVCTMISFPEDLTAVTKVFSLTFRFFESARGKTVSPSAKANRVSCGENALGWHGVPWPATRCGQPFCRPGSPASAAASRKPGSDPWTKSGPFFLREAARANKNNFLYARGMAAGILMHLQNAELLCFS